MIKFIKYRSSLLEDSRNLRSSQTAPERIVWSHILSRRKLLGLKFLRQKPIGNYIVDFYCSELKLAIEIDGNTHDYGNEYDALRTKKLNEQGVRVIRYTNADIMQNLNSVYLDLEIKAKERKEELTKK